MSKNIQVRLNINIIIKVLKAITQVYNDLSRGNSVVRVVLQHGRWRIEIHWLQLLSRFL